MQAPANHGEPAPASVRCAVLTVSDTRTPQTDRSGPLVEQLLAERGYEITARALVRDEPDEIADRIERWLADTGIQAVITTGGTGISTRDRTIDVVRRFLSTELDGFGELFRMLSYDQVGGAAMLSRAVAGIATGPGNRTPKVIFALPGSTNAVQTAVSKLIAPQLAHIISELEKGPPNP